MTDSRRPFDAVQPEPIDDNEDRMGSMHELDFDDDEPSAKIGDELPENEREQLMPDERVREAKGAKKVILSNVLGAKYERILAPMAPLVLVPDQAKLVSKKYMQLETLFHELSHSLGPGTIVVKGQKTTVSEALKDQAGALEEAKADVMGAWNILFMMQKGELPAADK